MIKLSGKSRKYSIHNGKDKEEYDYISGIDITTKIIDKVENIDINIIGIRYFIEIRQKNPNWFQFFKIAFVAVIFLVLQWLLSITKT